MKEELISQIKELISINGEDTVEINPNYLEYFEQSELEEIKERLLNRKKDIEKITSNYLDEIYDKTKKDEI